MYKIRQRYQRIARGAEKVWTDWFIWDMTNYTEEEGKAKIKELSSATKKMDQVSGLKHEFELVKID